MGKVIIAVVVLVLIFSICPPTTKASMREYFANGRRQQGSDLARGKTDYYYLVRGIFQRYLTEHGVQRKLIPAREEKKGKKIPAREEKKGKKIPAREEKKG